MPAELVVTRLTGFGRGKKSTHAGAGVTLGTDAGCDVRFDPTWDKMVKARHARLEWVGERLWLEALAGAVVTLNGRAVTRVPLDPGAEVEVGAGGPKIRIDYTPAVAAATVTGSAPPAASPVAAAPVAPAPLPLPVDNAPVAPARGRRAGLGPTVLAAAAAVVAVALVAFFLLRPAPPEEALAAQAKKHAEAVGLVVIVHPQIEGGQPTPMATAWAVAPRVYATNAHVSAPVRDVLARGGSAYIVVNRQATKKLKITRAIAHPRYGKPELNFEGKPTAVEGYDVGLLYVDEDAPKFFRVAPRRELERLDSGYRIGYLGFPMEGMAGGGVELRSPVATMQSGIVTSVTDYWLAQAAFEKSVLVQHNLGATGGASGSPLFNARGEVVAILNSGNIIGVLSFETGQVSRAPSGVMVNFAQRVDLLRDIWPDYR